MPAPEVQTLRIEIATGDLVMLRRGTIVGRWKATGQYTTGDISVDADGVTDIGADTVGTAEVDDDSLTTADVKDGTLTGTDVADASLLDADLASKILKDLGAQCVGYVDVTGVGADTETITINSRVYELDTHAVETITGDVAVDVSGGSTVKSQGTLTLAQNALDTETVTIDGKVYTFQAVLTDVDGNVLIGATASDSIDNLIAAINGDAGAGSTYAASMTTHTTVSAAAGAGDTMVATALAGGVEGDLLATTTTLTGGSAWDAATLGTTTAGVSPTATEVATALAAAINGDASRDVDAIDVGDGTVLLVAEAAGSTDFSLAEAGTNIEVSAATCVGAAAAAVKSAHHFRRTLTAQDATTSDDQNGVIPIGAVPATSAPSLFLVQVRDSNGVLKACANVQWSWAQANSNFYVLQALETQTGASDFAASDTVDVVVFQ